MDDQPVGRVADVERLLQLLSLLRDGNGEWVAAVRLRENVAAYRNSTSAEAQERMMQRDLEALRGLGFAIDSETREGTPARHRMKPTAWRVPLDLDRDEEQLLAWVMSVADATGQPSDAGLTATLGPMPRGLEMAHQSLREGRRLIVLHAAEETEIEPAMLSIERGRWFLIARYVGAETFNGFRLDRLDVIGLGDLVVDELVAPDPRIVTDNTAWLMHDQIDVEVRCAVADRDRVSEWFPRATVTVDGTEAVLRLPVMNVDGLIDRVLRFAGTAWVTEPPEVVKQLTDWVRAVAAQ